MPAALSGKRRVFCIESSEFRRQVFRQDPPKVKKRDTLATRPGFLSNLKNVRENIAVKIANLITN